MEDNSNTIAADEAAVILKNCGFDDATVQRFHLAALSNDTESLRRQFFVRELHPLPDRELRPVYSHGTFPEPVPQRTAGGAVMSADQLLRRVRERTDLLLKYGDAAIEAAPRLFGEPIL